MNIESNVLGLAIGIVLAYIIFYLINKTKNVSKASYDNLNISYHQTLNRVESLELSLGDRTDELNNIRTKVDSVLNENKELNSHNAVLIIELKHSKDKFDEQQAGIAELHRNNLLEFREMASKILEEKSEKFTATNKGNIDAMLKPLAENIDRFSKQVNDTYDKESKERFTLEKTVKDLIQQTDKVSLEANNLATALKGSAKKQGNWGEMILESILQISGLVKDREYFLQQNQKGEEGVNLRPDVVIKFPDDRVVIIDSKVSLLAYDRFVSADTVESQTIYLAEHIRAVKNHIDVLSSKKYDDHDLALDYTMLFMPIEPAYLLAIQNNPQIWDEAFKKRIILISPTNLIACLKLIANLWQRDNQSKNAQDIAKIGKELYEKIVGFTDTFARIGTQLQTAQNSYQTGLNQLNSGRGNLISKAIKFNDLGINSAKKINGGILPLNMDADEYLEIIPTESNDVKNTFTDCE